MTTARGQAGRSRISPWRAFPADPADWFSAEEIDKANAYQRPLRRVGAVDRTVRLALGLFLIGAGVPGALLGWLGVSGWWQQVALICVMAAAFGVVTMLPAGAWRQLVYDRRCGFSNQTFKGFLADEAKGFAVVSLLLCVFTIPTWAVVRSTSQWWVYGWMIFAAVALALGVLYPVLIAPIFNKFTPLADSELRSGLLDVARLVHADVSEILVEDSSKRTTKGNAYVSGLGRTRRVVLYDTMVDHPPAQLRSVVAHELGHWKLRHLTKTVPASIALAFVTFAVLGAVLSWSAVLQFAHVQTLGDPVGVLLFLVAFPAISKATGLAQHWMSRSFEREADLFALVSTGDTNGFLDAMRSLHTANLNDLAPTWWKRCNATHPPAAERLAMGRAWGEARGQVWAGAAFS
jgi:STE24 endopeptidase